MDKPSAGSTATTRGDTRVTLSGSFGCQVPATFMAQWNASRAIVELLASNSIGSQLKESAAFEFAGGEPDPDNLVWPSMADYSYQPACNDFSGHWLLGTTGRYKFRSMTQAVYQLRVEEFVWRISG
jgi:hypothetical protein